jgi:hypothetical protein
VLLLLVPALAGARSTPAAGYDRIQSLTTLDIIERLGRITMRACQSTTSRPNACSKYLRNLTGRSVLLRSDIDEFDTLRTGLDDHCADLSAFAIWNR